MRRDAPACQWQPLLLEEVGSCPEYFSYSAPPLESKAAIFSCGWSRDNGVGQLSKTKGRGVSFSSLGYRRGRRDGLFPICCNFLTKHTIVSPRKKGPKEKPGALGRGRRGQTRDAGDGAQQGGRLGFLGSASPTRDG